MKQRFFHYHIRKTGGTSVNEAFFGLNIENPKSISESIRISTHKHVILNSNKYVGANTKEINKDDFFYGFTHAPYHRLNISSEVFQFCIFRNPMDRVISHYNMIRKHVIQNIQRGWVQKESKWLSNDFNSFLHKIPKEKLLAQLYCFSSKFDVEDAAENINKLDYFFNLEEFEIGLNELSSIIDMKLKSYKSHETNFPTNISNDSKKKLRKMLELEYRLMKILGLNYE
nr:sulfotransferase family 2 domain-containing protein [uncultured Psychroserpens sp.]